MIGHDEDTSSYTPEERVDSLSAEEIRLAMIGILASIVERKDTRYVPDILHTFHLLAKWEVYDAENAWQELEDEIMNPARYSAEG